MRSISDLFSFSFEELCEAVLRHPQCKKMGNMPFTQFIMTLATTPITSIELVVRSEAGLLLTFRRDGDFCGWHFPGGALWEFESLQDACFRIARNPKEIGAEILSPKLICIRNYNNPASDVRHFKELVIPNHFVGLIFQAELLYGQKPSQGIFFCNPPLDILPSHKHIFESAMGYKNDSSVPIIEG